MRIISFHLPAQSNLNLGQIDMDQLGSLVVIAGANGAGKTRLLNLIKDKNRLRREIQRNKSSIQESQRRLTRLRASPHAKISHMIPDLEKSIENLIAKEATLEGGLKLDGTDSSARIVSYVPNSSSLHNPSEVAKNEIHKAVVNLRQIGVSESTSGALHLIHYHADRYWYATHQSNTPTNETRQAIVEFDRLNKLIQKFLRTNITRKDDDFCLFGLPLGECSLSDGQSVILKLCVALFSHGTNLKDLIVFMDEPENHLHPIALLEFIDAVRSNLGKGQLWIATHSIPLLASVDPSTIWWMENGSISKAGKTPAKVLGGLLGSEQRREELARFLDLPFAFASNKFAAECLIAPDVVGATSGDRQLEQIRDVIHRIKPADRKLRILDFGAGKGRLASELSEELKTPIAESIDYFAYDVSSHFREECISSISRIHANAEERLFHKYDDLLGKLDASSFDVIVMCNVLHEINPREWGKYFGEDGKLVKLLRPEGFLLIVEVQQLPYGETAHEYGFLVLDTSHLKIMFKIKEADSGKFLIDSRANEWLKAHLISNELLKNFTAESRNEAIKHLSETALTELENIRSAPKGGNDEEYRRGKLNGFWCQQSVNALMAIREF